MVFYLLEMETKSTIGLSWAPKLPPMLTDAKKSLEKGKDKPDSTSKPKDELIDGLYVPPRDPKKFNKMMRKNLKDTAGKSWFDMPAPTMTPELKKDLEILKLRNVFDPKRFFKKGDSTKTLPKYFQMGTVIETASEYYSSRLTKKERKTSFAEELLADTSLKTYRKRKMEEIEAKSRPGGNPKWRNKGSQTWKGAKDRRH